jgi:hypothetical protein
VAERFVSIDRLLATDVVTKVVSRVAETSSPLGRLMGLMPGGSNEITAGTGSTLRYDIFNNTRRVAPDSGSSSPSIRVSRQKVGTVFGVMPRTMINLDIPMSEVYRNRQLGSGQVDQMGQDYIARQEKFLGQMIANRRVLFLMGCVRGKIYRHGSEATGYWWDFDSSSYDAVIEFQPYSGNLSQLNMLGAGNIIDTSWASSSANIPDQISKIDASFQKLVGARLENIVLNDALWNKVVNNDYVIQQAGIGNTVFSILERNEGTGPDGRPVTTKKARLQAIPWIDWNITNEGVEVGLPGSGTYTSVTTDTTAFFGGALSDGSNFAYMKGDEPIVERDGEAPKSVAGFASWAQTVSNPAVYRLFGFDIGTPVMMMPQSTAFGTCVFGG